MTCKNCDNNLRTDFGYCPTCGAKVVRSRLTLKNVWEDISFQVFNLDNTLLKTIRHLFTQPDEVINSYVNGTRKRYMNPISFYAIGVTLSGIMFYVLQNIYEVKLTETSFSNGNAPNMDYVFDYQGILSYLIMPFYALLTWILFLDKRVLNYTEHLVANAYIYGQVTFVQFLICIPLFGLFDVSYEPVNGFILLFMVTYQFYVLKKIHKTGIFNTIIRWFAYLVLLLVLMIGIGIIFALIGFLTGAIKLEDFAPK
ncbi:DUF3667 domain-containing protein [Allomuricauda sp. ARW1Y1]|jgi:hypothetical protein|uniref:DUF3667 domain-containing protein n=1 Tax=Allomuricauda sp. ARW1Y1 TaxID=2663843 RepID=UPI0015CE732E|nr:DUF3667 domain-containing protein [Muricauda sp. ARW1Y1]NYJ27577.1 hypothetical protein [Muricauda sp. ARW1Y1]